MVCLRDAATTGEVCDEPVKKQADDLNLLTGKFCRNPGNLHIKV